MDRRELDYSSPIIDWTSDSTLDTLAEDQRQLCQATQFALVNAN
jgi:hypothetical protein